MDLADLNAQELFGDAGDISSDEDDNAEKVVGEDGEEQVVRRVRRGSLLAFQRIPGLQLYLVPNQIILRAN